MTAYFDQVASRIHRVALDDSGASEALAAIESDLVRDVGVCSMMRGFPWELIARVHQTVARWSFATREDELPPVDLETVESAADRLESLCAGLHSVFHDVARAGMPGFNDDPRSPLRLAAHRASGARLAIRRMFGDVHVPACEACGTPLAIEPQTWSVGVVTGLLDDPVRADVPGWGARCPREACPYHRVHGFLPQVHALRYEAIVTLLMSPGAPAACVRTARVHYLDLKMPADAAVALDIDEAALLALEDGPAQAPIGESLREALLDRMARVKV